ncbi:MAG TPA: hypothetical protein PK397_11195 [Ignavibacteriaceae bacterium]|jgi:hypothetical protein|nr:hypothetical protein [Ignavibacteriaceae bacterium]
MIKVVDNDSVTVMVYPEKKIVHHQFHKFVYGEVFKKAFLDAGDAFVKYGCTKWLSDDRGNNALKQDDIVWAQENWEGRLFKAGWKYWALVMPEKVTGQLSMKKIIDHYNSHGLTVKTFTTPEDAMAWLEKQ